MRSIISSLVSSKSTADTSTRAVITSLTQTSINSKAFCINSERVSLSTLSSSATSRMDCNSSTALPSSSNFSPLKGKVIILDRPIIRRTMGVRTKIRPRTAGCNTNTRRLAFFLATILGMVSPKIMTAMVSRAVPAQVHWAPMKVMTSTEAMEELAMFTRLLPMRMVDRAFS